MEDNEPTKPQQRMHTVTTTLALSILQSEEADDNPNADADDVLNLGFKPFDSWMTFFWLVVASDCCSCILSETLLVFLWT